MQETYLLSWDVHTPGSQQVPMFIKDLFFILHHMDDGTSWTKPPVVHFGVWWQNLIIMSLCESFSSLRVFDNRCPAVGWCRLAVSVSEPFQRLYLPMILLFGGRDNHHITPTTHPGPGISSIRVFVTKKPSCFYSCTLRSSDAESPLNVPATHLPMILILIIKLKSL